MKKATGQAAANRHRKAEGKNGTGNRWESGRKKDKRTRGGGG